VGGDTLEVDYIAAAWARMIDGEGEPGLGEQEPQSDSPLDHACREDAVPINESTGKPLGFGVAETWAAIIPEAHTTEE
jgi:hypothetical protein